MKYKKIAKKIIQMAKFDQKIRRSYMLSSAYLKKMNEIDKLNLKEMKKIVNGIGWPTIEKVGRRASYFAWLLVQHADTDVEFQEHCLLLMKKEIESGEVAKNNAAFLTDRVLINKGMKQIYGTQFYRNKAGRFVQRPIKDIDNIDKRRKDMDMESFGMYLKRAKNLEKQSD